MKEGKKNLITRARDQIVKDITRWPILLTIGIFIAGIIFWGAFNTAMEVSNSQTFCISCHEMRENVYKEYRKTVHYQNRTGVRATCPDCHVPKTWGYMVMRKISATNELFHHSPDQSVPGRNSRPRD